MNFSSFGLDQRTLSGIDSLGFSTPTPIQEQVIPHILKGLDVTAIAQTGSGKTASYVIPILEQLAKTKKKAMLPRCLVLVPTRELATQVETSFAQLGSSYGVTQAVIIGGESPVLQDRLLKKGPDIIIATPGRLLDLYERSKIMLHAAQHVVIDEADRMLDMGFIPDIERIMTALTNTRRQTLCFSATMDAPIKKLIETFLKDPIYVSIQTEIKTADSIEQFFIIGGGKEKEKRANLRALIDHAQMSSAIIFCNRKTEVSTLARSLNQYKLHAAALHGDLRQSMRTKTLADFKEGKFRFLVASDIAARGLDIDSLPFVINYELPMNAEEYVHRVGRTGRAGKTGCAYSFIESEKGADFKKIKTFINQEIKVYKIEDLLGGGKIQSTSTHTNVRQDPKDPPQTEKRTSRERSRSGKKKDLPETVLANSEVFDSAIAPASPSNPGSENNKFTRQGYRTPTNISNYAYPDKPVKGFGSFTPDFFNVVVKYD